jgi:hypothetical protein
MQRDGPQINLYRHLLGQRGWPGLWWSATLGRHVGYESWLERGHLMLLDLDAREVGVDFRRSVYGTYTPHQALR